MSRHNIATIDNSAKFSVVGQTMRGVTTPSSHFLPTTSAAVRSVFNS